MAEVNDTIYQATRTALSSNDPGTLTLSGTVGDNLSVSPGSDVDFFELQLDAGTLLSADIDARLFNSPLDSVLRLFDSSGNQLAVNDDSAAPGETFSFDSFLNYQASVSGTYYLGVSGYSNFGYDPFVTGSGTPGSTGDYILGITVSSAIEPNDTILRAINTGLNSSNPGTYTLDAVVGDNPFVTSAGRDVDFFQVTLNEGGQLTVDIDARENGSSLDSVLRVFDASGNALAVNDDSPAPGENFSFDSYLNFTAGSSGTYYVGVSGFSNFDYSPVAAGSGIDGSTGSYTINITV